MGWNKIRRSTVIALLIASTVTVAAAPVVQPLPTRHVPDGTIDIGKDAVSHPSVHVYLEEYRSPAGLRGLQNSLNDGLPYWRHIETVFHEYGLPKQLVYVALIESGFDPHAVSRSGAVGIWQFMDHSVEDWMIINSEIDERRDFYRSTIGAAEKLRHNYLVFNDWLLAIAAYNAGVGHIRRALEETGSSTYWDLLGTDTLPDQTRSYVPRFIAVSYLAGRAGRYGLIHSRNQSPEWRRVAVPPRTGFSYLSERSGIPPSVLMEWNPQFHPSAVRSGTETTTYINVSGAYFERFDWLSD